VITSQLLQTIATHLGPDWSICTPPEEESLRYREIQRKDRMTIQLYLETNTKLTISMKACKGINSAGDPVGFYDFDVPKIGISANRTPEAIAKDIKRRLLTTETKEWWLKSQQAARESTDRYNRSVKIEADLRARYPNKPRHHHDRIRHVYAYPPLTWQIVIEASNPNNTSLMLDNIPIKQVIALLDLYHQLNNTRINKEEP